MLRKTLKVVATATFLLGVFEFTEAAYVIRLKNGNEYLTSRYWYRGGQVLFDTYGGVFGIDKGFVSKIESSNRALPSPTATVLEHASSPTEQPPLGDLSGKGKSPQQGVAAGKDQKSGTGSGAQKEALKKDESVLKEYGELQTRFGQLNDLPKHEVHALDADINSFREKLGNSDLAEAHRDEIEAMKTLQRAIASYLKATYP